MTSASSGNSSTNISDGDSSSEYIFEIVAAITLSPSRTSERSRIHEREPTTRPCRTEKSVTAEWVISEYVASKSAEKFSLRKVPDVSVDFSIATI